MSEAWTSAQSQGGYLQRVVVYPKCMKGDDHGYAYLSVDRANKCRRTQGNIKNGEVEKCFIELWVCAAAALVGHHLKYHNTPVRNYRLSALMQAMKHFDVGNLN